MINVKSTIRLISMPIIWMGGVQLVFAMISFLIFRDHVIGDFFVPALLMLVGGFSLLYLYRNTDLSKTSYREALAFATSTWIVSGMLGALPITTITHASFTDSVFESISALTTTGATVLSGLDDMPPTFLLYRQFLQWMGGLGIVIFVVAVMPMLNVGGMRLLKAETPGPVKDDKLSPRVANTTQYLWGVYIAITILCTLAYYAAGMSFFDAIAHSLTTVSTGGFSTHDASMGYFHSHLILAICNFFMLLGAISFALHFRVFHHANYGAYFSDEETRIFIIVTVGLSLILAIGLVNAGTYSNLAESISYSTFHIISFITSTGYGADDFGSWSPAAGLLLIFSGYLGGCAGSTAGGNKFIRNILTLKVVHHSMQQLIHPKGIFVIKYNGRPISTDVTNAVSSFMMFVALSTLIITLIMMSTGLEFWSAFSAVAACVNVTGPGFGEVGSNFQPVTDSGTWILSGTMILGRLEYFTVFAIFSKHFWRP